MSLPSSSSWGCAPSSQSPRHAGLLHNWGVGLHSLGTHAGEPHEESSALEQAAQRLRDSAAFARADAAPLNALGDVRMAQVRRTCSTLCLSTLTLSRCCA